MNYYFLKFYHPSNSGEYSWIVWSLKMSLTCTVSCPFSFEFPADSGSFVTEAEINWWGGYLKSSRMDLFKRRWRVGISLNLITFKENHQKNEPNRKCASQSDGEAKVRGAIHLHTGQWLLQADLEEKTPSPCGQRNQAGIESGQDCPATKNNFYFFKFYF